MRVLLAAALAAALVACGGTYKRSPLGAGALGVIDAGLGSIYFGADSSRGYYIKYNGCATCVVVASRARDGSGDVMVHTGAGRYPGAVTIGPGTIYWVSV